MVDGRSLAYSKREIRHFQTKTVRGEKIGLIPIPVCILSMFTFIALSLVYYIFARTVEQV